MFKIMEYDHVLNRDIVLAEGETLQAAFLEFEKVPHNVNGMIWVRRVE